MWNFEAVVRFIHGWVKVLSKLSRKQYVRYVRITPGFSFLSHSYFLDVKRFKIEKVHHRGKIDSLVADHVLIDGCYDFRVLSRYRDIVAKYAKILADGKQPLIVDCGGNIGLSTLYFSREFPKAYIVCIEPDKENSDIAKIHTPSDQSVVLRAAVGSSDGFCEIENPNANEWAYEVAELETGDVELISIPKILDRFPKEIFEPMIIKVDIEGFEKDLFSKNTDWIEDFYLLSIELHDWIRPNSAISQNFLKSISTHKRDFILSGENIFSVKSED